MVISLFLNDKLGFERKESGTDLLVVESCKRFETYTFKPQELFLEKGTVYANAHRVNVDKKGQWHSSKNTKKIDLSDNTVITIRLEPPFNIQYYSAMQMLSRIKRKNFYITNCPTGILNMPEKFIPSSLQEFTPETLIASDVDEIIRFYNKHKEMVLKPPFEFGGHGIMLVKKGTKNLRSIIENHLKKYNSPIIAQKFIPGIAKGDKRIIFLDGEVLGQMLRVPPKGKILASLLSGGKEKKCGLTKTEKQICAKLKPILKENGIFLCAIDVIDDHLTEINVTCPSAIYFLNTLYGMKTQEMFWDRLEQKLNKAGIN